MSELAHVTSVDAIREFRAAWCNFAETAKDALAAVDGEVGKAQAAVAGQLQFWKQQVRKLEEVVGQARITLNRRKLGRIFGTPVDCTVQEEELRKVQQRYKAAEAKVESLKRWLPRLDRAVLDYQGPRQQLVLFVELNMANALAALDQKLTALDEYIASAPPEAPLPPPREENR